MNREREGGGGGEETKTNSAKDRRMRDRLACTVKQTDTETRVHRLGPR